MVILIVMIILILRLTFNKENAEYTKNISFEKNGEVKNQYKGPRKVRELES